MKRVGIYSGSFDPVHEGHLAFAREAIEQCDLDKVFFLVEPRPRRKQGVKALEHRDEMVRLAIKDDSKFGSIQLKQQRFTSVDTLPILQERFKNTELHMLMGDDMLAHFADWPHVDKLIRNIRFIIAIRLYSAAEIRKRVDVVRQTRGMPIRYDVLRVPSAEYSARSIRKQIKAAQKPQGLSPRVLDYITEHNLYASSKLGS